MGTTQNHPPPSTLHPPPTLHRHFGLLHATALNVTMIVGAGVFVTIPVMLKALPGPLALLGWVAAGALMLVDCSIWSELGAACPGSGGSYLYLLESYGRDRWGRLMAFLFIWQFLISGPLEISTAFSAAAQFSNYLSPKFEEFNQHWTRDLVVRPGGRPLLYFRAGDVDQPADGYPLLSFGPARLGAFAIGIGLLALLYRRIAVLGKVTITFWLGVLAVMVWILIEGGLRFDPRVAFDFSGGAARTRAAVLGGLGAAMIPAIYSYLGYYNVCYIGDEVRDPGRTIPRAIYWSAALVCLLFVGLHLAMLGTVSWHEVPTESPRVDHYSLAGDFMLRVYGSSKAGAFAAALVTVLLIWSCLGSAFAGLLGYSRIPYGAARYGHFFSALGRVHPVHHIPHVSLLVIGGLTLFWSFFKLEDLITALITTRILEQFIGQIGGVMLLRRTQPDRPRPYRIWLYPLPCALAAAGWLYVYLSADPPFIFLGLGTLAVGVVAFGTWSWRTRRWPFEARGAWNGP